MTDLARNLFGAWTLVASIVRYSFSFQSSNYFSFSVFSFCIFIIHIFLRSKNSDLSAFRCVCIALITSMSLVCIDALCGLSLLLWDCKFHILVKKTPNSIETSINRGTVALPPSLMRKYPLYPLYVVVCSWVQHKQKKGSEWLSNELFLVLMILCLLLLQLRVSIPCGEEHPVCSPMALAHCWQ